MKKKPVKNINAAIRVTKHRTIIQNCIIFPLTLQQIKAMQKFMAKLLRRKP